MRGIVTKIMFLKLVLQFMVCDRRNCFCQFIQDLDVYVLFSFKRAKKFCELKRVIHGNLVMWLFLSSPRYNQ